MKVVIYARVSDDEQNTDNQINQLVSWAATREWDVTHIYKESESAWKGGHQHELAHLLDDARKGRFSIVLVWALDRLSREGALATLSLTNRLKQCGVRVLSHQESWTEAPGELGELLFALTAWVARMESQRRSERTKAGLQRLVAGGKKLGRPQGARDKRKRKRKHFALNGTSFGG